MSHGSRSPASRSLGEAGHRHEFEAKEVMIEPGGSIGLDDRADVARTDEWCDGLGLEPWLPRSRRSG